MTLEVKDDSENTSRGPIAEWLQGKSDRLDEAQKDLESALEYEMGRACSFIHRHFGGWPEGTQGAITHELRSNGLTEYVAVGSGNKRVQYIGIPDFFYIDKDHYTRLMG